MILYRDFPRHDRVVLAGKEADDDCGLVIPVADDVVDELAVRRGRRPAKGDT